MILPWSQALGKVNQELAESCEFVSFERFFPAAKCKKEGRLNVFIR